MRKSEEWRQIEEEIRAELCHYVQARVPPDASLDEANALTIHWLVTQFAGLTLIVRKLAEKRT